MKTALEEINQNMEVMGGKLSNMVAFVNFECKKVELMLRSKYFGNSRDVKAYEQIHDEAMTATFKSFEQLANTTNLELIEELESSRKENAELREAMDKANQRIVDLEKSYNDSQDTAENVTRLGVEGISEYIELTSWYETMIAEMKNDEATEVKWYQTYKWQGGMALYIQQHPKPKVGTYIVKNAWGEWVMGQK